MSSLTHTGFNRYSEPRDTHEVWLALAVSVCLHAGIFYLLPHLEKDPIQPMVRMVVEMNPALPKSENPNPSPPPPAQEQIQPEEPVKPVPKPVVKPKTEVKKKEIEQPLLSSQEPATENDYVVPEAPSPEVSAQQPTPPEAASTSSAVSSQNTELATAAPATESSSQTASIANIDEAWEGYGKLLYDLVSRNKSYPPIAVRRNWEGNVTVHAKFSMGKLVEIRILEESGREVLDKQAIDMVKKAVAQLPVRGGLANKSFAVTVPVAFNLDI